MVCRRFYIECIRRKGNEMNTERTATAAEVRKYYKDRGDTVRISRDGRVVYKDGGDGPWLEGRWVEEYRASDEYGVLTV